VLRSASHGHTAGGRAFGSLGVQCTLLMPRMELRSQECVLGLHEPLITTMPATGSGGRAHSTLFLAGTIVVLDSIHDP